MEAFLMGRAALVYLNLHSGADVTSLLNEMNKTIW